MDENGSLAVVPVKVIRAIIFLLLPGKHDCVDWPHQVNGVHVRNCRPSSVHVRHPPDTVHRLNHVRPSPVAVLHRYSPHYWERAFGLDFASVAAGKK